MPPHSLEYLSSKPFEIKSTEQSYFIHGDILAPQSDIFRSAIISGGKRMNLSNCDSNIVKLFAEFLHTQDYQMPERISDGDESEAGTETETETETEDGERRDRANTPDTLQSFMNQEEGGEDRANTPDNLQSSVARGGSVSEDVGTSLMIHAKMYGIGRYIRVRALPILAFERLKTVLGSMNGRMSVPEVMASFIELLEYVYSHKHLDNTTPEEPIRDLVSTFAAENFDELVDRKEVASLLVREGGFALELVRKIGKRFSETKSMLFIKESTSMQKAYELEVANAKIRELEAKLRDLNADNAKQVPVLECTNAVNVQKMADRNPAEIRVLGSTWDDLWK